MNTSPQPQGISIEQALAQAHAHWEAGQSNQAEHLCQQVLAAWPGQSDALHLLGLMAYAFGNLDLAIDQIRRACQAPRAPPAYLSNLAEMCRQRGLLTEGEQAARRALALEPTFVGAWNNLGIILQEAGKLDESLACLNRVVHLRPDDPLARNNLGNTLKRLGKLTEARAQYDAALALQPTYAEALSNMASLLNDMGQPDQALASARRAIDINPRHAEAYINAVGVEVGRRRYPEALRWAEALLTFAPLHAGGLAAKAIVMTHLERPEEALDAARQAVSAAPDSSDALNALGEALQALGQVEPALAAYDKAALASGFGVEKAMINRGVLLMEQGRKAEAREALEKALAVYPASASAWMTLSDLKTFARRDPDIERMESLLRDGDAQARSDQTTVHFALAKAWMDAGEPVKAFAHLNEGNRMQRETFTYDAEAVSGWLASIPAAFGPELYERLAGAGARSQLPVFVLGMPRSGTSLVEQILASHPDVHGAGELSFLQRLADEQGGVPAVAGRMTTELAERMGEAYLAQVTRLAGGKKRVVDKMPSNFLMAGLIPLILPDARIIHVRRDPADIGLSCYTKLFAKEQLFTYDLAELGRFLKDYDALMEHWRKTLPANRFTEVVYEDLVDNLEGEARRLIGFIGLKWDKACLNFHETKRAIRTASVNQVRQPVFKTSVGRWKPYAAQLKPLLDALGMAAK